MQKWVDKVRRRNDRLLIYGDLTYPIGAPFVTYCEALAKDRAKAWVFEIVVAPRPLKPKLEDPERVLHEIIDSLEPSGVLLLSHPRDNTKRSYGWSVHYLEGWLKQRFRWATLVEYTKDDVIFRCKEPFWF